MVKKFFSLFFLCVFLFVVVCEKSPVMVSAGKPADREDELIKWVDFNVSYEALSDAMEMDVETYEQDLHIDWVSSLAYLATVYGGSFAAYKKQDLLDFADKLNQGESIASLTRNLPHYAYYETAYDAVIGDFLAPDKDGVYGLCAYSPIAEGYWYTDSDDFGNGRSYGFARKHLGHDLFTSPGTPVVSVEDGKVEALGWNQYGGWRIGIRSNDGQRYYYYAHLRKDSPYVKGLKIGDRVSAGQIIGFSGQTGYSIKKNVNNIQVPHLHFGMQLIFDESQKECNAEIWIDVYPLVRLLAKHRAAPASKEKQGEPSAPASAALSGKDTARVPILMYHALTKDSARVNDYFLPAETFVADMQYLSSHGYSAVTMNELIAFVYDKGGRKRLPKKPVVISFDDGFYNNLQYASPVLEKYGMKAVISVIGKPTAEASETPYKNLASCNATWAELREMRESGLWEIQNHTYDLHSLKRGRRGAAKAPGESPEEYETVLKKDLTALQNALQEKTGASPKVFTWPFGAYTEEAGDALKSMGFCATLGCLGGVNTIKKGDPECLYMLRRNLRSPGVSIESCLTE